MLKNYSDLKVWLTSYRLCLDLYRKKIPKEEKYGLTSQIMRTTVSIPSNVLNYVNKEYLKALKDHTKKVERMLKALIKSLENKRLDP